MATLALAGDDVLILLGMAVSVVASLVLIGTARRYAAKSGFVLSGIFLCLGLAHFGWRPLFGHFSTESAFGCVCLLLGLLSIFVLRLLDGPPQPRDTAAPATPPPSNRP